MSAHLPVTLRVARRWLHEASERTRAACKAKAPPWRCSQLLWYAHGHGRCCLVWCCLGDAHGSQHPCTAPPVALMRRPHMAWQVLHGERSLYNARGGWDLARFLADADRDDVEAHLANLRCGCGDVGGIAAAAVQRKGFASRACKSRSQFTP